MARKLSRRTLLVSAGATGAGVALAAGGYVAGSTHAATAPKPTAGSESVEFYGVHQAGISTPAQEHLVFATYDLTTTSLSDIRALMRVWTESAATLSLGKPLGEGEVPPLAPFPDTGETLEDGPERLTITFGFGPTLFTKDGIDRFGLASKRPAELADLPTFPRDVLDPARVGGDLCIQACADNPQVAFHAIHNLTRLGRGTAAMRWSQLGFNRTSSTSTGQVTPRNLMGFKDGTNNLKVEEAALLDQHVWANGPAWMRGGSYLVARRIRMRLEAWDRDVSSDQENVIGRYKVSGAPLGQGHEFDPVDLAAKAADGSPAIPVDAHVRLAIGNGSIKILRRGYSFADGMDPRTGQLDAGLFFLAYQRDPTKQFVPLQRQLAQRDALNEYIVHVGSALFACPPGTKPGGYIGEGLFDG